MQLIRSKIERPAPEPHIVRNRLVAILEESLWSGLATFVVGRAGTGKSVAALDLADAAGVCTRWYALDASDTDLERFTGYLFAALGLERGPLVESPDPEDLAECLLGELFAEVEAPLLLVVENLHLVYDAPWFGPFFARFLPMLPRNVHLLATTRSLPPVPLWRMRSKQALSVVDEETLAFSEREAVELFARYLLPNTVALRAHRLTRGRAAQLDSIARGLTGPAPFAESHTSLAPILHRTR
jgi:LuxR family maltose regulon positive regulatory protein